MEFNEKLTKLRKEKGMTQEDLAFEVGVSRQSISKWELGEVEPDLSNLKAICKLFNVSLDYLVGEEEYSTTESATAESNPIRRVGLEETKEFLSLTRKNAPWIALGVLLCILSPVALIVLGGMSEVALFSISENVAAGIGIILLLALVATAVAIFILRDGKVAKYRYFEKELFQADKEVFAYASAQKECYRKRYLRNNVIGVCLCILSIVPLFIGIMIDESNAFLLVCLLSTMFPIAGGGVFLFVLGGVIWGGFEKVLQTEEYSPRNKKKSPFVSAISTAYWLIVTALFLGVSFFTAKWQYTWLIWAIAGILYPALLLLLNTLRRPKDK